MAEYEIKHEVMVLNDLAKVGDRVAVAISAGRYGNGMRTGTILEIQARPILHRPDEQHYRIKIRVEQTSGTHWGPMPYVKTLEDPQRMVKLGSMVDAL